MAVNELAGVLSGSAERRADPAALRRMLAASGGTGGTTLATAGPAALGGVGQVSVGRHGRCILAAGVDLLNRDDLRARTGLDDWEAALVRLYRQEGGPALRRLRGAFALALWDEDRQELMLAVDHFGIRRLYYAATAEGLLFASRAGSVVAGPLASPDIDRTAVYEYLNFGYIPAPRSIWKGIRRLPPGHVLIARPGSLSVRAYWDLAYPERRVGITAASRAIAGAIEDAIAASLRGQGVKEAGAFLSGGTDSSAVVGLMARLTGERVNAFSIGFHEPRYDERSYASLAARHFDAAHHTRVVSADEAFAALPELVEAYDEPFGNNSAIGTLFCARLARETGVGALLAGDGGDEIFGGNERYRTDRIFGLWQRVPGPLRRGLLEPALAALGEGAPTPLRRVQRYVRRAVIPNPRRFYSYEFFFAQEGQDLLDGGFVADAGAQAPWRVLDEHFSRAAAASELHRLMYLDLKLTIGDNDLLKVTRTAERAGVRVRFPLLDVPLVELTATLPARFKLRGLEKRYLFKHAFRTLLPAEILAKRKHGFGVPTGLWLRTHPPFEALARDALLSPAARQRGYFRPGVLEGLFARHAAEPTPYYGELLWTVLMLELWHRRHGGGPPR
jgi:asparagine synthase (glutamine-hydrolysing)